MAHPHVRSHDCNAAIGTSSTTSIEGFISGGDHLLPVANVGRIMKQALPPNAKISKEAKQTMQECASEFIGFVTGEASDRCCKEKRKTINGDDICCALKTLGLDDYASATKWYLNRYRDHGGKEASMNRNKSVSIGVSDVSSVVRSDQSRNIELALSSRESNDLERTKRFL